MITGMHAMFYSSEAVELRVFLRDVLGIPARDAGGGWLIFDLPKADMGVHPTDFPGAPPSGTHAISLHCTDIQAVVERLRVADVALDEGPKDDGYGPYVRLTMPGGTKIEVLEPRY
jgi:hypothetical protein